MSAIPGSESGLPGGPAIVSSPDFVGRQREVAALTRALATPPTVILIEGEAGIGKTRLVREFLAAAGEHTRRALVASCPPFREPHTLGPAADALRQVVDDVAALHLSPLGGTLRPLFPEWSAELPAAPDPADDPSSARHRVFRALTELLGRLEIELLVVEDVHWADEATLEFLLHLTVQHPQRISLIVTYRPEEIAAESLVRRLSSHLAGGRSRLRVELGPLDVTGTAMLMSSMLADQHVSAEFADFVHEHTDGVPLAVEESVRLMGEREDLTRHNGEWVRRDLTDIVVPPTIRDSVLERAGRLSSAAHTVLQSAAVLTEPVSEVLLSAVADLSADATRAGLSHALASGLLSEDARGLTAFHHVLAQRAVYEAIPAPVRRTMHRRAGAALESLPAPAARLARHFRAAAEPDKWREYATQAAELAATAGDEQTAANLVIELIRSAPGPAVFQLLDHLNAASLADPVRHLKDLENALRDTIARGGLSAGAEGLARFQLGRAVGMQHDFAGCRTELQRAIPYLRDDPAHAAWAMTLLGWPHDNTWPASVHLRWLHRAATLTDTLEPRIRARIRGDRISALLLLGDPAGFREAEQLPVDQPPGLELRILAGAQGNLADMAMRWGRHDDARRWLDSALRLADTNDYVRLRTVLRLIQAHLDWFTGDWDGLRERLRRTMANADSELGMEQGVLVSAFLDAATGARAQAAEALRQELERAKGHGATWEMGETAAALARLELANGDVDAAVRVTDETAAVVARKGIWLWAAELGPARVAALSAAGRLDEAQQVVLAFGRWLRDRDVPAARAGLILSRAILAEARGRLPVAVRMFGLAAEAWQALPRPYDALLAREAQARCLLAGDRGAEGIAGLRQVAGDLASLGASEDALRVKELLRAHGVEIKRDRPGRPSYGSELSPRELDVARLLVHGTTNKEIAERLFLSPKTVARHVESAMRKLGVASRTALAVQLVERAIVLADQQA